MDKCNEGRTEQLNESGAWNFFKSDFLRKARYSNIRKIPRHIFITIK